MESFDDWCERVRKNLPPEPNYVNMPTEELIAEQLKCLRIALPADFETLLVHLKWKYRDDKEFENKARATYQTLVDWRVEEIERMLWAVAHNRPPERLYYEWPVQGLWQQIKRFFFGDNFTPQQRLGVGVMVVKNRRILLGKRLSELGYGQWALPGGGIEFNESLRTAAKREVDEECGLCIRFRPFDAVRDEWCVANHVLTVGGVARQYVGFFLVADWVAGEPAVKEPAKIGCWKWFDYDEVLAMCKPNCPWLPTELFSNYRGRIGL